MEVINIIKYGLYPSLTICRSKKTNRRHTREIEGDFLPIQDNFS